MSAMVISFPLCVATAVAVLSGEEVVASVAAAVAAAVALLLKWTAAAKAASEAEVSSTDTK